MIALGYPYLRNFFWVVNMYVWVDGQGWERIDLPAEPMRTLDLLLLEATPPDISEINV